MNIRKISLFVFLIVFCMISFWFANLDITMKLYMSDEDQMKFWNKKLWIIKELGITRFDQPDTYRINSTLRRDEAAKMITMFSQNIWSTIDNTNETNCDFSDLQNAHSDLHSFITTSCTRKIFKWYNGAFMPTKSLTNGEFVAVLIRAIEWNNVDEEYALLSKEKVNHRADNYHYLAKSNELLKNTIYAHDFQYLDSPIYRWDVAIIFANYIEKFKTELCWDIDCDTANFFWNLTYQWSKEF